MSRHVDRHDIQGIIASGYDHLNCARFILLRIEKPETAKRWLTGIARLVTCAEHPGGNKPRNCLNLAVTWKGLCALGVGQMLGDISHEFVAGMNRSEARSILGDSGESSAERWEFGGDTGDSQAIHLLVLLYGETLPDLESLHRTVCDTADFAEGLSVVKSQDSNRAPGDLTEPFGFRDGISQPPVRGLGGRRQATEPLINTGEFVLGYENELGYRTPIPSIDSWADPTGLLPDHPDYAGRRRGFGLNGTYLVFRKLVQKVDEFRAYIENQSRKAGTVDPRRRELLAAKMMGRWRSGAPLVLSPEVPGSEPRNDFLFMPTDPDGLACPIGSHIRRANPRDSLDMSPASSLQASRRHRIIRRGRKFSEPSANSSAQNPKYDQGLYFIALNADLRRQFEFVQQSWLNNPSFNGIDNDKDPIVGDNESDRGSFTIQSRPINERLSGLPRFVTVRGGGYFFLPGIRAIGFLARCQSEIKG